jgi:hypothetical protein
MIPDLYDHFMDEEIDVKDWLSNWFSNILSKELPLDCVLRLWDTYFSIEEANGLELHTFVCLAILLQCKEDLEGKVDMD